MKRTTYRLMTILVLVLLPLGMGTTCNETLTDDDDADAADSQHPNHDPPKDDTGDKDLP